MQQDIAFSKSFCWRGSSSLSSGPLRANMHVETHWLFSVELCSYEPYLCHGDHKVLIDAYRTGKAFGIPQRIIIADELSQ